MAAARRTGCSTPSVTSIDESTHPAGAPPPAPSMTSFRIAVFGGDGIGPEVVAEAVKVLRTIEAAGEHRFEFSEDVVGGAAIDAYGTAIRKETIALAKRSDAVLFGAVG